MRLKKQENNYWFAGLFVIALGVLTLWPAAPSFAYSFQYPDAYNPSTGHVCAIDNSEDGSGYYPIDNLERYGFTKRIAICVKESVISAIYDNLVPFSDYIADTVSACITLAILLWGALMATGKNSAPMRDMMVMAVKIGAVGAFTWNFAGLYPLILDAMEYMLSVVTDYVIYSPSYDCPAIISSSSLEVWDRVDCALEQLIGGIFAPDSIMAGITGFLVICLFSGSVGIFVALLGFLLIGQFLYALAQALYIYITSYIAFAFMVLISPLFIPLLLFRATKAYFEKWLKLTIGFMLQPIFLFAYLAMLLAAFDTIVYTGPTSLYRTIAGDEVDEPDFKLGEWLYYSPIYGDSGVGSTAVNLRHKQIANLLGEPDDLDTGVAGTVGEYVTDSSAWGGDIFDFLNPGEQRNFFKVDMPTQVIDWDWLAWWYDPGAWEDESDTMAYVVKLFLAFIMAVIMAYILVAMLQYLPFIGSGVSGETLSMPTFGTGGLAPPGGKLLGGLQDKVATYFGGGK